MKFAKHLDRVILEDQELALGSPQDVTRARKAVSKFNHAADITANGLEDLIQLLRNYEGNEAIVPIMAQIQAVHEGLKRDGQLRLNLEKILSIPTPKGNM